MGNWVVGGVLNQDRKRGKEQSLGRERVMLGKYVPSFRCRWLIGTQLSGGRSEGASSPEERLGLVGGQLMGAFTVLSSCM